LLITKAKNQQRQQHYTNKSKQSYKTPQLKASILKQRNIYKCNT